MTTPKDDVITPEFRYLLTEINHAIRNNDLMTLHLIASQDHALSNDDIGRLYVRKARQWAAALVGPTKASELRDEHIETLEECLQDLLDATADGSLTLTGPLAGLRRFIATRERCYEALRKEEPDAD